MMVLVGSKGPLAERRGRVDRQGARAAAAAGGRQEHATSVFFFLPLSLSLTLLPLLCVALSFGPFQSHAGSAAAWADFPARFACVLLRQEKGAGRSRALLCT